MAVHDVCHRVPASRAVTWATGVRQTTGIKGNLVRRDRTVSHWFHPFRAITRAASPAFGGHLAARDHAVDRIGNRDLWRILAVAPGARARAWGQATMAMKRRQLFLHGAISGVVLTAVACGEDAAPAKAPAGGGAKPADGKEVNSATGKGTPTVAAFTGAPLEMKPNEKELYEAAKSDGKVVVYSTTDSASAKPLVDDFNARFPGITLDYQDLNSTDLFNKFTAEFASGTDSADVVWSSAMDQQMKMVQDGMAGSYQSPEQDKLPQWARYQEPGKTAWGTTLEPFAFVYNKKAIADADVPKDHASLVKFLTEKADALKGKVTTYDPEKSGTGYLAMSRDVANFPAFWDLAAAMGKADAKLYTSTGTMIEKIGTGEHAFGYNIIGSYVLPKIKADAATYGMVFPTDFTLGFSRVAFIAKKSKRLNAAKLFLDHLLSKRGQDILASKSMLYPARTDAEGEATAAALQKQVGDKLKPIPVSAQVLDALDQTKRLDFVGKWQKALGR